MAQKFEATQEAVQEERRRMLAQLRTIKAELARSGSGGGGGGASSREVEALREENERLRERNEKQAYRIEHLCASVKELQGKVRA